MPTTTEEFVIVVSTDQAEVLDALGSKLDKATAAKKKLDSAMDGGAGRARKQEADVYDLADAYEVLGQEQESVFTSAVQVGRALDPVEHAMAEVGQKAELASKGIRDVGSSASKASSGMSVWQQRVMAGSYAFQDFTSTSGDLGAKLNSVSNNIPQLLAGMGSFATGVGIAVTAGVALYKNWDAISSLWETRRPIPIVAGDLDELKREVDANSEALDKLRAKRNLDYAELEKYQELTRRQIELEAQQAQARETEANKKAHGAHANEADKEAASGFGKALDQAGGYEAVVKGFVDSDVIANAITDPEQVAAIRRAWEKTINDALKGDQGAISTVSTAARLDQTGLTRMMDLLIANQTPEAQKAHKDADEAKKQAEKDRVKAEDEAEQRGVKAAQEAEKARIKAEDEAEQRGVKAAQRIAKEEEKAGKDAAKVQDEQTRAQVKRANEQENASIQGSGLDRDAARMLAEVQAAGGVTDRNGRKRKLTEDEQFEYVRRRVAQYLHRVIGTDQFGRQVRANRGMGEEETFDLSTRIAAKGRQQLDQRLTAMSGQQLNNTGKLIAVAGQLGAELAQQHAVQMRQGEQIQALLQATQPRTHNARNRGRGG